MGPDLLTVPWREENLEWKKHDPKTPDLSSSKSELIRMKRKNRSHKYIRHSEILKTYGQCQHKYLS
jgi:hypothetical protein